jgi:hypothetical protein
LLLQGIGYYKPLTQFSKGEYPGANQLQDDLAIIAGKLGYAPKVNGDSIATATPMPATITGATASSVAYGVVQKAGAPEYFKIQAAAGSATIRSQLTPSYTNTMGGVDNRADLDMRVTVIDASGTVIANLNPPSFDNAATLEVAASAINLPADGVYYVAVAGAGSGYPKSGGYSDYGEGCCYCFSSALHVPSPVDTCIELAFWVSHFAMLMPSPTTCTDTLLVRLPTSDVALTVLCLPCCLSPCALCRVPWAFCSASDLHSPRRRHQVGHNNNPTQPKRKNSGKIKNKN